ncbi:hypothetical protein [Lentibacillus sp.]|uniref:hypothetical protein n=1 Tax=Lentibacillus sp. TaxID=1925746 RepID=UPI002B4ABDA5|nr:hypothetical protein [Lentibacillus sp.]HLS09210.1 hypothetical protein [Lentibacillus sp.]
MKKRYIVSVAGAVGAGITGYLLKNQDSRNKLKTKVKKGTDKLWNISREEQTDSTLEDAGVPDQAATNDPAQLENAKMVSEGSQFGVEYYNQVKEVKGRK